jgi:hypothetical protein
MADFLITAPDGRKFRVSGANKEGALAALQAQLANAGQPQASQGDTSMGTAFSVGNANAEYLGRAGMAAASRAASDGIINDFLTAGREYVANPIREALDLSPIDTEGVNRAEQERLDLEAQRAGQRAKDQVDQTGYRSLQTGDIKGLGSLVQYAGQKVAETAPNMLASIASGGTATIPLMIGEGADATKGLEGLTPEQKADLAVGGGAIMGALENLGIGKLLPKGVSQSLIGAIAKGMVTEGTTEALQEIVVIGQEAVSGKQFAPGEIIDRLREAGVAGAVVGGTIRTGTVAVDNVTGRSSSSQQDPSPETRANASLAQRLQTISSENGWNLRDVSTSSTEGARQTVDNAHVQLSETLKQNFKDLRAVLGIDVKDSLSDIENKVMAQAAYREARNKTKNVVGKQEINALKGLAGNTYEGQQALNTIFELNELTKLHNAGYKGGLSQFTDFANPFDSAGNTYNSAAQVSNRIIGPALSTAAAVQTGGTSIPVQLGIAGTGRAVDALTGRRSRVAKYVRNNVQNAGLDAPNMPSLSQAKRAEALAAEALKAQEEQAAALRAKQLEQTNRDLSRRGAAPTPDSPQWTMEDATGLSKNGVARVMRIIEAANNDPIIAENIAAYRKSIDTGGRIPDLSPLIRAVNLVVDSNPALEAIRVKAPNRGGNQQQTQQGAAAGPYGPTMTTQENYNRGIEDNKALLADLKSAAQADNKISKADKAKITAALDDLSRNLGADPFAKVADIMQTLDGVDETAIDTYVGPYIERVAGQQGRTSFDQSPRQEPRQYGEKTDVSLSTSLANAYKLATGKTFTKGRDLKLELQRISQEMQKAEGLDLNTLDEANIDRLADFLVEDAVEAIKDNKNAIGWYDRTVTSALETVAKLHPEILSDPASRLQFTWAVAVTSNGLKVDKNFELALDAYEHLKATGRFPTDAGIGQAADAIDSGLAQYHTMLDKFRRMSNSDEGAHQLLIEFMNSKVPVKQLEKEYGVQISGEGKNTPVRGAAILGPKIGNGFFSNLYGNFDELTMDRWLMRTVGRWRGGLVKINKPMVVQKTSEIQQMMGTLDLKQFKPLFEGSGIQLKKKMSKENTELFAAEIAKRSMKPDWRGEINAIEGGEALRKAGNALAKYLDGQVEAPAGARERDFIREVFKRGLARLQNRTEVRQASNAELTMSDLQALLWYPEKRLYDTAKQNDGESRGYEDDEAPDYANAARKAVRNRLGSPRGAGPDGGGAVRADAGQPSPQNPPNLLQPGRLDAGNQGVAARLAERLTQRRVTPPPTDQQVKEAAAEISEVFTIGKKGSKYENGIKDIPTAMRLAKALDYAVSMFDSQILMRYFIGMPENTLLRGAMALRKTSDKPDLKNLIVTLEPKAKMGMSERQTTLGSLTTILHEIGHGLAGTDGGTGFFDPNRAFKNPYTGKTEYVVGQSFEGAIGRIMASSQEDGHKNKKVADAILDEIENLQNNISVYSSKGPKQQREVRGLQRTLDDAVASQDTARVERAEEYFNYARSLPEFAVDPVWVYLYDPALAKSLMPYTTQVIRALFKSNNTITFHSHPLAMVVAIFAAILAQQAAGDDEEKKRSQQQPGLLSQTQGQGLLTA